MNDGVHANVLSVEGPPEDRGLDVVRGIGTTTRALAGATGAALDVTPENEDAPRRAGDLERSVLQPNAERSAARSTTSLEQGSPGG